MNYESIFTLAQAATAQASQGNPNPGGGIGGALIPMVCIIAIFYFMIIRPQNQKQKQQQALISSVKTGDEVVTSGGIHGLVTNVKETTVMVKIADNVKIEVDKIAIATVSKRSKDEAAATTAS